MISLLETDLIPAMKSSKQWIWERQTGGLTTDCISGLSPKNRGDMAFQLLLGFKKGTELMEGLQAQVV